ncbi:uncharacterized protein LOC113206693 [Frankliniella occidentalis]|uniref:Uncharacterized protein LOC113206693 n=1 Tax=Frankliniella occidentalis TaxID=133901 RepID=A0A6J1SH71_FRAOC|nr:uncharacterized protein LOC113206693 [Frankliniella occidentalis]
MAAARSTTRKASATAGSSSAIRVSGEALPPGRRSAPQGLEPEKLDSWFEGVSQPSRRIQDLVRRKRERHDGLVRQLRQELFRERSAAESTVAFISANLRTELDKASLMVKLKGQEVAGLQQADARAFAEAVAAAGDVVQQLTEQRRRAVDAFYDLLLDVEGEHQKRAKGALKKYGAALASNGHLPPHRLQPVLDAERKEVSELHLRHVISFGDLRLCLNMHAERDCRRFREAVENTKRLASEQRQRGALTAIQSVLLMGVPHAVSYTQVHR